MEEWNEEDKSYLQRQEDPCTDDDGHLCSQEGGAEERTAMEHLICRLSALAQAFEWIYSSLHIHKVKESLWGSICV